MWKIIASRKSNQWETPLINGSLICPTRGRFYILVMPSSVTQAEQPPSAAGQGSNKFIFEDFTIWCAIRVSRAVPRLKATGWCFQWRPWAHRCWLGSDERRCLAERAWSARGTSWVRLHPPSRWTSRRNSLWHVSREVKEDNGNNLRSETWA